MDLYRANVRRFDVGNTRQAEPAVGYEWIATDVRNWQNRGSSSIIVLRKNRVDVRSCACYSMMAVDFISERYTDPASYTRRT